MEGHGVLNLNKADAYFSQSKDGMHRSSAVHNNFQVPPPIKLHCVHWSALSWPTCKKTKEADHHRVMQEEVHILGWDSI